jgi:hypothetical protein
MANEIVSAEDLFNTVDLPANPYVEHAGSYAGGGFLPRLQLEGSSSKSAKKGRVKAGSWVLFAGQDLVQDFGDETDVFVCGYRTKALDLSNPNRVVAVFDPKSQEFKRIQEAAKANGKGYMFGLEFLVFVPDAEREEHRWATLYMGNKTGRNRAASLLTQVLKPTTLKVDIIDNGEYVWEGPIILPCSSGLSLLPTKEQLKSQLEQFYKQTTIVEEVPEETDDGEGRVR